MDIHAKITSISHDARYFKRTEIYITVSKAPQYTLLCDILRDCDEATFARILIEITSMCDNTVLHCTSSVQRNGVPNVIHIENATGEPLEQSAMVCVEGKERKSYLFHIHNRRQEMVVPVCIYSAKTIDMLRSYIEFRTPKTRSITDIIRGT